MSHTIRRIQSIEVGFRLIRVLESVEEPMPLKAVAAAAGMRKVDAVRADARRVAPDDRAAEAVRLAAVTLLRRRDDEGVEPAGCPYGSNDRRHLDGFRARADNEADATIRCCGHERWERAGEQAPSFSEAAR